MIEPIEKWTCTDPDTLQYGRQISDGVYEFREWKKEYCGGGVVGSVEFRTDVICWNDSKYWNEATITLSDYRYKGIDETVSNYGHVLLDNYLLDGYSLEDSKWLIAKCLFEEEFAEAVLIEPPFEPNLGVEIRVYFVWKILVDNPSHFTALSKHSQPAQVIAEFDPDTYIEEQEEFITVAENLGNVCTLAKFQNLINNWQYDFSKFFIFIKTWE